MWEPSVYCGFQKHRWQPGLKTGIWSGRLGAGRLWHWAPTSRIWCYFQADTVRTELNCRVPGWCPRIAWCRKVHTRLFGVQRILWVVRVQKNRRGVFALQPFTTSILILHLVIISSITSLYFLTTDSWSQSSVIPQTQIFFSVDSENENSWAEVHDQTYEKPMRPCLNQPSIGNVCMSCKHRMDSDLAA